MSTDRNLLFGLLAVRHKLISEDQLVAGLLGWINQKSNSLADVLEAAQVISQQNRQIIEPLVTRHLSDWKELPSDNVAAPGMSSTQEWKQGIRDATTLALEPGSATTTENRPQVGQPTSAGRFRILKFHAAGGLGQVSLARDSELNRNVALKEIKPEFAEHSFARNRFLVEAEITGGLEHPSIVPVYGLGTYADGRPFYAMRFIQGETLRQAIDRYHRQEATAATDGAKELELRNLLGRFGDVCQAVAYAHSRGILHRDLKPDNVMLGNYGETFVVDWGLAKTLREAHTSTGPDRLTPSLSNPNDATEMGELLGTLRYMSPEQATGRLDQLSRQSDIFCLGATLYHLLTGKVMYAAANKDELLRDVTAVRFPHPRTIRADIPKPLAAICLRALAAEPESRYPSARALLDDLERYLADEPVSVYREPFVTKVRRTARKHPGIVSGTIAAVAVTLLALTLGTMVLGWKNQELAGANLSERTQRLRAEREEGLAKANATLAREQENLAKQNEAKAREEEAVAMAVKNFLLNDLLALSEPEMQSAAGLLIDPDLRVKDLFHRASEKLERQFPADSPVARELKPVLSKSISPQFTVRELLQRASKKIDGHFVSQPLIEHDVRLAIALALRAVGEFTVSLTHFERCRELVSQLRAPDDPAVLSSLSNLATSYQLAGRTSEAIPLLKETLALRQNCLGLHHHQTLQSMNNLANTLREDGQLKIAIPMLEETLRLRREHLGQNHPDTISSLENLASGYLKADRHREANALYVQVLERREAVLGPEHLDTIRAAANLGMVYRQSGQFNAAARILERALQLLQKKLGEDHPSTLTTMASLANTYRDLRRLPESLSLQQKVLELREQKSGPAHPLTLNTIRNLGMTYRHLQRPEDALRMFQRALDLRRETLGPKHPETLVEMSNVGDALSELGRGSEAIPLYEAALTQLKEVVGQDHPFTLLVTSNLAIEYRQADRLAEAIPLLEQVYESKQKKFGLRHLETIRTLGSLAIAKAKQKEWLQAEKHFLTAWEAMESLPAELRDQFRQGLGPEIIDLYEAWKRPEEVEKWRKRLAQLPNAG